MIRHTDFGLRSRQVGDQESAGDIETHSETYCYIGVQGLNFNSPVVRVMLGIPYQMVQLFDS